MLAFRPVKPSYRRLLMSATAGERSQLVAVTIPIWPLAVVIGAYGPLYPHLSMLDFGAQLAIAARKLAAIAIAAACTCCWVAPRLLCSDECDAETRWLTRSHGHYCSIAGRHREPVPVHATVAFQSFVWRLSIADSCGLVAVTSPLALSDFLCFISLTVQRCMFLYSVVFVPFVLLNTCQFLLLV